MSTHLPPVCPSCGRMALTEDMDECYPPGRCVLVGDCLPGEHASDREDYLTDEIERLERELDDTERYCVRLRAARDAALRSVDYWIDRYRALCLDSDIPFDCRQFDKEKTK